MLLFAIDGKYVSNTWRKLHRPTLHLGRTCKHNLITNEWIFVKYNGRCLWFVWTLFCRVVLKAMSSHTQYMYIVIFYVKCICVQAAKQVKTRVFGKLFWPVSQRVQINFIFCRHCLSCYFNCPRQTLSGTPGVTLRPLSCFYVEFVLSFLCSVL